MQTSKVAVVIVSIALAGRESKTVVTGLLLHATFPVDVAAADAHETRRMTVASPRRR